MQKFAFRAKIIYVLSLADADLNQGHRGRSWREGKEPDTKGIEDGDDVVLFVFIEWSLDRNEHWHPRSRYEGPGPGKQMMVTAGVK